jgi:hypothetical protein
MEIQDKGGICGQDEFLVGPQPPEPGVSVNKRQCFPAKLWMFSALCDVRKKIDVTYVFHGQVF